MIEGKRRRKMKSIKKIKEEKGRGKKQGKTKNRRMGDKRQRKQRGIEVERKEYTIEEETKEKEKREKEETYEDKRGKATNDGD